MGIHSPILPRHRRLAIEAEIAGCLQRAELLIARLDRADAPFEDLEDDDPGGTFLDDGEGEGDHGRGLLKELPTYGADQRRGPLNYQQASTDHRAAEMGLVRSPTGGWRHPS